MTKKNLLAVLFVFVLAIGLASSLFLVSQQQQIGKRASTAGGGGKISLNPATAAKYPGQIFPVVINFRTGSGTSPQRISAVTLRITYPYSGTTPELDVVDSGGNSVSQISPDSTLVQSGDWVFPIKSVIRTGSLVVIEFSAINTNITGYSSSTDVPLTTLYLKANRVTASPIILTFDTSETKMTTKTEPITDILDNPVNGSYTTLAATLSLGFKLQGVNLGAISKEFQVTLKDANPVTFTALFVSNATGVFFPQNPIQLSNYLIPPSGRTVDVLIKDGSHLAKKLGSITLTSGANTAPASWNNFSLLAGDFVAPNNILTIDDISAMLTKYTVLSAPADINNRIYDVNNDGSFNVTDIALVLANFTALTVPGDN